MMDAQERAFLFESAMEDYRARLFTFSARTLRRLVDDGSVEPFHLSYCGLLTAMTRRQAEDSIALCRRAVEKDGRRHSELYWNLARVLAIHRRRGEAVSILEQGLALHPDDPRLRRELQKLVPRAKPVIGLLPRRHPLNKFFGIARSIGARLAFTFRPRIRRSEPKV
jgi:predicted Zn-dependent protease